MDPGTAMLIATAVAAATKASGDAMSNSSAKKSAKNRAKETKRETLASHLNEAHQRSAELEGHRLNTTGKKARRRVESNQETSDLIRRALNI